MNQEGVTSQGGTGEWTGDLAVQTTSIGLPNLEPHQVQRSLGDKDRQAISALPAGSALLIALSGPNQGARFLLDQDTVSAGRHPDADIFLDDVTVSRQHARFERVGSEYQLVDAGSLNGTYVNHDRVDSIVLRSGMEVQLGKFRLTYYASTQ